MTKWLAVGLVLVTTTSNARAQVHPEVSLMRDEPVVGPVTLSVILSSDQTRVTVFRGAGDERLLETPLQVWVLRSDGTALQRRNPKEPFPSFGTGRTNWADWYTLISFERAKQGELSAVVVSVDGVPFVRPLPRATESVLRQP
jgi:hypothetical protein